MKALLLVILLICLVNAQQAPDTFVVVFNTTKGILEMSVTRLVHFKLSFYFFIFLFLFFIFLFFFFLMFLN